MCLPEHCDARGTARLPGFETLVYVYTCEHPVSTSVERIYRWLAWATAQFANGPVNIHVEEAAGAVPRPILPELGN